MITGEHLIDVTRAELGNIQQLGETGMETFLLERGIEPDAIRVLCRCYGQEIVDSSDDVGAIVAQALILGFVGGFLAKDTQAAVGALETANKALDSLASTLELHAEEPWQVEAHRIACEAWRVTEDALERPMRTDGLIGGES